MITIKTLKDNIINFINSERDTKHQQQIKELVEKIDIMAKRIKEIERTPMFKPVPPWIPTQPLVPYKPIITCNNTSVWVIDGQNYNLIISNKEG